jgi:tripartite-type tricarboxylate transporter receptor subunit TctC
MRRIARLLLVAAAALSSPSLAQQAEWPARPVRIIVPFSPGGSQDLEARGLAAFMEPHLKTSVYVENKPGGGAVIGIGEVARAAPDGYTLLVTGASVTQLNFLRKDLNFDATKDLVPISQLAEGITTIVTNRQSGIRSWQELLAYAKANPGKLSFGGIGISSVYIAWEAISKASGINIPEVPYAGQSAFDLALLRNDVQVVMGVGYKARVDAGDVVPLLTIGERRHPQYPQVPTTSELGYGTWVRGFAWIGLFAPSATAKPIVDRISAEAQAYVKDPAAQKRAAAADNLLIGNTPEQFKRAFDDDTRVWGTVAKAIDLRPQ